MSVVLSAQTTDVNVNKATPKLFARFPDAKTLAAAEPIDVEPYVASLGFFRSKSKSIVGLARALVEKHGGEVPKTLPELVALPGVGRKTANVVLGVLWNIPEGVVVDTHVQRLAQRLGWSKNTDPEKIERDLCRDPAAKRVGPHRPRAHLPWSPLLLRAQARLRGLQRQRRVPLCVRGRAGRPQEEVAPPSTAAAGRLRVS